MENKEFMKNIKSVAFELIEFDALVNEFDKIVVEFEKTFDDICGVEITETEEKRRNDFIQERCSRIINEYAERLPHLESYEFFADVNYRMELSFYYGEYESGYSNATISIRKVWER